MIPILFYLNDESSDYRDRTRFFAAMMPCIPRSGEIVHLDDGDLEELSKDIELEGRECTEYITVGCICYAVDKSGNTQVYVELN